MTQRQLTEREQERVLNRYAKGEHPTAIAKALRLEECADHIKRICADFNYICTGETND